MEKVDINDNSTNITQSISRATRILLCLSQNINTITGIADNCSLSVSTVHRILKTLEGLSWVRQDPVTRNYYLGPLVTELSSNPIAAHQYLIIHSLNQMIRLSTVTGETVNLGVMIDLNFVVLHEIPSRHYLRIIDSAKYGLPIVGATGKVMLSQLQDDEIKRALRSINAQREKPTPHIDTTEFMGMINTIRKNRYDISFGEVVSGGICISAPVENYRYPVSLSVIGPGDRMKPQVETIIKELKISAMHVSLNNAKMNKGGVKQLKEESSQ